MKKRTVAKLKVTRKLEDTLPAFLDWFSYPCWYLLKYISDSPNISAISPPISAIFSLYRRFNTGYRLTDNFQQPIQTLYPITKIKRSYPHGNFFSTYPIRYLPEYINDFSNISIVSPLISTIFSLYRRFDTSYRLTDTLRHSKRTTYPIPQAIYCRTLRLKR